MERASEKTEDTFINIPIYTESHNLSILGNLYRQTRHLLESVMIYRWGKKKHRLKKTLTTVSIQQAVKWQSASSTTRRTAKERTSRGLLKKDDSILWTLWKMTHWVWGRLILLSSRTLKNGLSEWAKKDTPIKRLITTSVPWKRHFTWRYKTTVSERTRLNLS